MPARDSTVLVEVFDPDASNARRLSLSGLVQPVTGGLAVARCRGLPTWATAGRSSCSRPRSLAGVVKLRQQADVARSEQLGLERLRSLTNEQSSLEWQAVAARGAAAEVARAVRSRRTAMDAELNALSSLGRPPDRSFGVAIDDHEQALQAELDLLAQHRFEAALRIGERRVDPSLDRLYTVLGRQVDGPRPTRARPRSARPRRRRCSSRCPHSSSSCSPGVSSERAARSPRLTSGP